MVATTAGDFLDDGVHAEIANGIITAKGRWAQIQVSSVKQIYIAKVRLGFVDKCISTQVWYNCVYGECNCGSFIGGGYKNKICSVSDTSRRNSILGGQADCVLALGFEKMQRGSLSSTFSDRANPIEKHVEVMFMNWQLHLWLL